MHNATTVKHVTQNSFYEVKEMLAYSNVCGKISMFQNLKLICVKKMFWNCKQKEVSRVLSTI